MGTLTDTELRGWVRAGKPVAGKSDGDGLTFTMSGKQASRQRGSWVLRYRHGGRPRELTLGSYPDVSLTAARRLATAKRAQIDAGVDVAGEKRRELVQQSRAKTFREVSEDYLRLAGRDLAERTGREVQRYLDKDLLRSLGSIVARDIAPQEIVRTIERIAKRSNSVGRHAFEILSVIFAHALARNDVDSNPCAELRLVSILGARPEQRPRLKLTREELSDLLKALPALGRVNALCAKILLATCVRKGELIRARKELIDLQASTWFVPDEQSKSGKGYVVPIVPSVEPWFRELIALSGESQWLLPSMSRRGRIEDRPMSDKTLNAALDRCSEVRIRNFTPHDLRSTARSHLAALGVELIVAERCLNHQLGGLVAIYDVHDYLDERRRALELWGNLLRDLEVAAPASNVVALRPDGRIGESSCSVTGLAVPGIKLAKG